MKKTIGNAGGTTEGTASTLIYKRNQTVGKLLPWEIKSAIKVFANRGP